MTIEQIKRIAADCNKTHRWVAIRRDFSVSWRDRFDNLRIVGIGRKYVRCMDGRGTITNYTPDQISKAW
jgi:hypothetical protein